MANRLQEVASKSSAVMPGRSAQQSESCHRRTANAVSPAKERRARESNDALASRHRDAGAGNVARFV